MIAFISWFSKDFPRLSNFVLSEYFVARYSSSSWIFERTNRTNFEKRELLNVIIKVYLNVSGLSMVTLSAVCLSVYALICQFSCVFIPPVSFLLSFKPVSSQWRNLNWVSRCAVFLRLFLLVLVHHLVDRRTSTLKLASLNPSLDQGVYSAFRYGLITGSSSYLVSWYHWFYQEMSIHRLAEGFTLGSIHETENLKTPYTPITSVWSGGNIDPNYFSWQASLLLPTLVSIINEYAGRTRWMMIFSAIKF